MNLLFRFFFYMMGSLFRSRLELLGTSVLTFRVFPNDLDINGHMNNGRYLTLMDIGRMDLVVRCGMAKVAIKNGWKPMVASAMIRFRKGLKPFQKYEMHSRIIGWDDRYTYLEHKIIRDDKVISAAIIKGSFVGKDGPVPSELMRNAIGSQLPSPILPDFIRNWQNAEEEMKAAVF